MSEIIKKYRVFLFVLVSLFIICLGIWVIEPLLIRTNEQNGAGVKISSIPKKLLLWDGKWSPDGSKIAFRGIVRREFPMPTNIYVYDILSGNVEKIPTSLENSSQTTEFVPRKLDWAPDGTKLYVSGRFSDQGGHSRIWVIDLENNEMEFFRMGESFAWSPSGDQIAILDTELYSSRVRLVDMKSNEELIIYEFEHSAVSDFMNIEWAPHDDVLAIEVPDVTQEGYSEKNIYLLTMDGTQYNPIIPNPSWQLLSPTWFPDGQWLAFAAYDSGEGSVMFAPVNGECMYTWLPQIKNVDNVDITTDGRTALVISQGDLYIVDLEIAARPPIRDGQPKCP